MPGGSHGRRSLVGCSPRGRWGSDTTEGLHFHFSLSCIGEGNGNPLQCSCLENSRDGGAWWAAVYGVAQSRTGLKQLSSSSSNTWQNQFINGFWMTLTISLNNFQLWALPLGVLAIFFFLYKANSQGILWPHIESTDFYDGTLYMWVASAKGSIWTRKVCTFLENDIDTHSFQHVVQWVSSTEKRSGCWELSRIVTLLSLISLILWPYFFQLHSFSCCVF